MTEYTTVQACNTVIMAIGGKCQDLSVVTIVFNEMSQGWCNNCPSLSGVTSSQSSSTRYTVGTTALHGWDTRVSESAHCV